MNEEEILNDGQEPIEEAAPEQETASSSSTTPQLDIQAEIAKAFEAGMAAARQTSAPQKSQEPDEDDELAELIFADPKAAIKRIRESSLRDARKEFANEIESVRSENAVREIASDLTEAGKSYLRDLTAGLPASALKDAKIKDVLRRAARDYDREKAPKRVNPEPSHSSARPVQKPETNPLHEMIKAAGLRRMEEN